MNADRITGVSRVGAKGSGERERRADGAHLNQLTAEIMRQLLRSGGNRARSAEETLQSARNAIAILKCEWERKSEGQREAELDLAVLRIPRATSRVSLPLLNLSCKSIVTLAGN